MKEFIENGVSYGELEDSRKASSAINRYLGLLEKTPKSENERLRFERHLNWVVAASKTLLKKDSTQNICAQWSRKTDEIIQSAWDISGLNNYPIGLLALGKLGSEELNLSSDVDFIYTAKAPVEVEAQKCIQKFHQLLAQVNSWGFCYRVDIDLRPGGRLGPMVSTLNQMQDYYWTHAATWERLAMVRARPLCGPKDLLAEACNLLTRFCYRKFLDYTLLEDFKNLRVRYHESTNSHERDVKLTPGGIRDIELFFHALLVLHGGKQKELQTHSTSLAVKNLRNFGKYNKTDLDFLLTLYWELRHLEHLAQSKEDQQTHVWRVEFGGTEAKELDNKLKQSNDIVSNLLGEIRSPQIQMPESLEKQKEWLKSKGFSESSVEKVWPELIQSTALSRRSEKDEKARKSFLYQFIEELNNNGLDKDLGIHLLLDFVKSTRAKATFFTLLVHEPRLLYDLALLFSTSPYLGGLISSRPELIDGFLLRAQEPYSEDPESLLQELTDQRLLAEVIASNQFLAKKNVAKLTSTMSDTADQITQKLLFALKKQYGSSTLQLLPLGKWGGGELGLRSDLDFIFLVKEAPTENDQKIARRFLSWLTEQHRGGAIYHVDLRLRPSGKAGPLLVTEKRLREYLAFEAAAWERQSYLRARPLHTLAYDPKDLAAKRGLSDSEKEELKKIRKKLIQAHPERILDIKLGLGGLTDIELFVQAALLKAQIPPVGTSLTESLATLKNSSWQDKADEIDEIYKSLRTYEQLHQLTSQASDHQLSLSQSSFARLSAFLGQSPKDLFAEIHSLLQRSQQLIKDLDPLI